MPRSRIVCASGDPEVSAAIAAELGKAGMEDCLFLQTGEQVLAMLSTLEVGDAATVMIDAVLPDISPLNLAGSISTRHPAVGVVLLTGAADSQTRDRAMLAGVRALVDRQRLAVELVPSVQRVSVGAARLAPVLGGTAGGVSGRAIAVVGARGGAGRTTISILAAGIAARAGLRVALVDFDLQFGDVAFVTKAAQAHTLGDLVAVLGDPEAEIARMGSELGPNLVAFTPSPQPERAEVVAPMAGAVIARLRSEFELVIVNTGAFWTLFHAEVLDASDLGLMVLSQEAGAVRASVLAKGLCHRLGIPGAKLEYVINRYDRRGSVTSQDAAAALQVSEVLTLPDGHSEVAKYMDAGEPLRLLDAKNPLPVALEALAQRLSSNVGVKWGQRASSGGGLFNRGR